MAILPIEPDARGMQRRHILVEQNRRRVARYEPTRKMLEEEDARAVQRRAAEKEAVREELGMLSSAQDQVSYAESRAHPRPMPGAAARAQSGVALSDYMLEAKIELQRKAEYHKLYDADMQQQLSLRRQVLERMRADEAAQNAALKSVMEEHEKLLCESEARATQNKKAMVQKQREYNRRQAQDKQKEADTEAARERERARFLMKQNCEQAAIEAKQVRDATIKVQMENDAYHREVTAAKKSNKLQDISLIHELIARDQIFAEEEKRKRAEKKRNYARELDESVERERQYRRENNYDEPVEACRERMKRAAQTHRLIEAEQRRRNAAQKSEHGRDLIEQIRKKHEYCMSHLDELK